MMPSSKTSAFAKRGVAARGRIRDLAPGRLCGFIETRDGRNVFFHAKDLEAGKYNDLVIGWAVRFELIVDHVSGDRAARIQVDRPARAAVSSRVPQR